MTEIEEIIEEYKKAMEEAEKYYQSEDFDNSIVKASEAIATIRECEVIALRKRAWSNKHKGHKNPEIREECYREAKNDAYEILEISKDVETRNSAIKLLILLPDENVKILCNAGINEAENSGLSEQEKGNLKAELKNSLGLEIKKSDPEEAMRVFNDAYESVTKNTTLAGHLKHNAGTCYLEMANAENNNLDKYSYLIDALEYLQKALKEYPASQTLHRSAVERKIKDTENKIKEVNQRIEEENK